MRQFWIKLRKSLLLIPVFVVCSVSIFYLVNLVQESFYCGTETSCKVWGGAFWSTGFYVSLFLSIIISFFTIRHYSISKKTRSIDRFRVILIVLILIYIVTIFLSAASFVKLTNYYLIISNPWVRVSKQKLVWEEIKGLTLSWDYIHSAGGPGGGNWDCQLNAHLYTDKTKYSLRNFGIDGLDPGYGSLFIYLKSKNLAILYNKVPECSDKSFPRN